MLKKGRNETYHDVSRAIDYAYNPPESIGWPPLMEEYIRKMILNAAEAIVSNIYTKQELEEKVEHIILDEPENT